MDKPNYNISIIRSRRKTLSLAVPDSKTIVVRVPYRASNDYIHDFISRNQSWIDKCIDEAREKEEKLSEIIALSELEIQELADKACEVFKAKVEYYAPIVGVTYGRITIRNQKTRWGSCSSIGNLNFNVALMRAPIEVLDYVVVHELCHRLHPNHSKAFWSEVKRVLPDYKEQVKWLKNNGHKLMAEIHGAK